MEASLYNSQLVVDTAAIQNNYTALCAALPGAQIIPVLKSNAYGVGAVQMARLLAPLGAKLFGVAHVSEAIALRDAGVTQDILLMSGVPARLLPAVVGYNITPALYRAELAVALAAEVKKQGKASHPVQLKIDTGLNRLGVRPGEELAALAAAVQQAQNLQITGTYTHFANGEQVGSPLSKQQLALYHEATSQLEALGINPGLRHAAASGSSEWFPDSILDAVRIGRRLYLDAPRLPGAAAPSGLAKEAFSWRSSIVLVKQLEKGDTLGYNQSFVAPGPMQAAIVPVGYGDGLLPELIGAPVLVNGKRGRLLATCMDQCFIDVTGIGCAEEDEVTFFGYASDGAFLSSQEVAAAVGHEGVYLTSKLASRVERVYI